MTDPPTSGSTARVSTSLNGMDPRLDALLEEILDEVEDHHGVAPAERARIFEKRAATLAPGEPGRAAWLAHAGEAWETTGLLEPARACYEQACDDGGPTYLDARAMLVGVLLKLGETDRADELMAELRRDVRAGRAGDDVHALLGEALEEAGRLEDALAWFDSGLTHRGREDPDEPEVVCLNGHYRVRRALGLPLDRYDLLTEERRREYAELGDEADGLEERLLDLPSTVGETVVAVLYWPPDDFAAALTRWPAIADDYGDTHEEHRRLVEGHLRELTSQRPGLAVSVAPAPLEDYLAFAAEREGHESDASTRAGYAAHCARLGRTIPWPPGRNDRCWCGSGTKYKRCCGALRFPDV